MASTGAPRFVRSTSAAAKAKEAGPNAPELRAKAAPGRIPSPTKLSGASMRRSQSVRQTDAPAPPPARGHLRQSSTSAVGASKPPLARSLTATGERGVRRPSSAARATTTETGRKEWPGGKPVPLRRASRSGLEEPKLVAQPRSQRTGSRNVLPSAAAAAAVAGNSAAHGRSVSTPSARPQPNARPQQTALERASAVPDPELLETAMELSQLHAIHSRSAQTQREWTESAREVFCKRFRDLVDLRESLDKRERADHLQKNARAIIEWAGKGAADTLERRIGVVSKAIDEFWHLTSSGGRYTATVEAFEHWYEAVSEVRSDQSSYYANATRAAQVMAGLGDGWKAEVESLQDRLLHTAQDILTLGDIDPDAELARCIAVLSEMMQNMLEELETLSFIEQSVVLQEQFWVQASVEQLSHGLHGTRVAI